MGVLIVSIKNLGNVIKWQTLELAFYLKSNETIKKGLFNWMGVQLHLNYLRKNYCHPFQMKWWLLTAFWALFAASIMANYKWPIIFAICHYYLKRMYVFTFNCFGRSPIFITQPNSLVQSSIFITWLHFYLQIYKCTKFYPQRKRI